MSHEAFSSSSYKKNEKFYFAVYLHLKNYILYITKYIKQTSQTH